MNRLLTVQRHVLVLILPSTLLAGFLPAQSAWRAAGSGIQPPARIITSMAEDPVTGRVVLFGGDRMRRTPIGDTWEWDGVRWHSTDAAGPSPRYGHAVIPFPALGGVLLFGGYNKRDTLYNDLWLRRGSTWVPLDPAGPRPRPRRSAAVAFDPVRGRAVVHGGFAGLPSPDRSQNHTFLKDTWEFDGRTWHQLADEGPAGRYGAGMAFDVERGVMVLFGGNDHAGNYGDTWTWDGRAWRQASTTGPPPRGGGLIYWDPALKRLVLVGGFAGQDTFTDTWSWDGSVWSRHDGEPEPQLIFPALVWHSATRRVLLVGQQAGADSVVQTWVR